jgi:phosphoadenylyl-sulfate reductase (thioredoxin)
MIDPVAASRELADAPAEEILAWGVAHVPRLTFATGFGAEGCVLLDLAAQHGLAFDVFTLDTGLLFPETYALWRHLEARYGISIRAVTPAQSVAAQALGHGPELWARDPDSCCDLRKVRPLRDALAGWDGWITAIRRDQSAARATAEPVELDDKFGKLKVNPLVAWTHDDVWDYVRAHDVPTNALHAQGYPSIGCAPCTSPVIPGESVRSGRWRHAAAKTECGLHDRRKAV